ncbi:hypothetical protein Q8F55_005828 [Vanrija albida]|uniref:BRCT domain-containing protein n=1 Tax=Vanrija albida TaxID=181172 RepID=A0ABR3Q2P2_9TREE
MRRSHPHRRLFTDWSFFVQPSPPDAPSSTELISDIDEHGGNIVYTPYKANVIVVYGGDAGAAAPSSSPPRSSSLHHSPHLHHSSHGTSSSKHREWDYHSLVHHFADVQGSRKTFWTEPQAPHLVVTPDWVDMCIRAGKVSAWRGNPAYDRWIVCALVGPSEMPIEDVPDDQDDSPTDTMLTSYENSVAPGGPKLPSHASLLAMLAGGSDPASPPTKRPLQARIHLYTLEQIEAKLRKPRFPPGESKRDFGRLLNNFCSRGGESIKDLLDRLQEGEIPNAKSLYKKHRLWIAEEVKRVKLLNERREYLERIQRISARNREREGE